MTGESLPLYLEDDPYISVRDYIHQWNFQEALASDNGVDTEGTYNLTAGNDPPVIVGGGRATWTDAGTMRNFGGSGNIDLNINCTIVCWYYRFADAGIVDYIFSNRIGTGGQFVLIFITNHWEVYFHDGGGVQRGPYPAAGVTDTDTATWKLMVFRYNATLKTVSLSINNGAASGSEAWGFTMGPAAQLLFGGDTAAASVQGHIGRRTTLMYNRILSASEEALIFAAGPTYVF